MCVCVYINQKIFYELSIVEYKYKLVFIYLVLDNISLDSKRALYR